MLMDGRGSNSVKSFPFLKQIYLFDLLGHSHKVCLISDINTLTVTTDHPHGITTLVSVSVLVRCQVSVCVCCHAKLIPNCFRIWCKKWKLKKLLANSDKWFSLQNKTLLLFFCSHPIPVTRAWLSEAAATWVSWPLIGQWQQYWPLIGCLWPELLNWSCNFVTMS